MPFIAKAAPYRQQLPQMLAQHDADQARRERNFKIRFSICLLAAVGAGSFIFAVLVTL